MFFAGFMLMVLMFVALCFSGAIYDAGREMVVQPWFFQVNSQSSMRLGIPATPADLGDARIREMLIQKYVVEYFYVIPDVEDIARRTLAHGAIAHMSSSVVFNQWRNDQAQIMQSMAEDKMLRTVHVNTHDIYKPDGSDYWVVPYRMTTWTAPNDFSVAPVSTNGLIFLDIIYEPGMRSDMGNASVGEFLERGGDPAYIFKFLVNDVVLQ